MKIRQDLTIKELLMRFPEGFCIAPNGILYEVIKTAKEPMDLPILFNRPGGFLAVGAVVKQEGDEFYLDN